MKQHFFLASMAALLFLSYSTPQPVGGKNWYICANCCKTRQADNTPWENGCRPNAGGTHNFWFCGTAGDFNWTCRNCDAEVYLTSSQGPSASKCCATGGTHTWFHR